MNKNIIYLIFLLLFSACAQLGRLNKKIEKKSLEEVIDKRISGSKSEYFYCDRINIKLGDDETKSFTGKVFIHKGKSIFINVSYFLGIELGRIQITHDSIKYINRIKKDYYFGKVENLARLTGISLSYEEIENLLIRGLPISYRDNKRKILLRFTENDKDYVYNYEIDEKRFMKIYFQKDSNLEYKIEFTDHNKKIYFVGLLNDYLKEPIYPGIINASVLKGDKKMEIKILINRIENRFFQNTLFKVNNNYNELVF